MSAVKGEAPPATEAGGGGSFIFERASFMNNMLTTRPSTDNNAAFWDFDGRAHVSDQPLPPPPGQDARPSNPDASAQSGATLDKESRWAHVRRLSALFQKLVTEVPASGELSKETYYEMYNTAVSLVRAVDPLDPDRAVQAARSSEVFMPTGSFSLALGGMANGAATGSAPTTAGADLDWLSRRSMDLFPRASFSLPHEPPLLPVPAPPPAPSPASAATSTTMSAPPASTPQQQQQQQLTSHLQSQQHLQLPPPPHGQYQHPAQSLQSQPSSGQPMLSMPPYHPSLTPPARMAQQQPQPPQQLQQQTQQMQQPQQSQQQPMQQQSQPSQQQPQQPPTFFGVSGPFVMNPGPYVMQNYLPPFATRAQQGANAPGGYGYPSRFLPSQQMQMASQSAPPPASSFPSPVRQTISLPPVIRTTSNQPEIIFTSGEEAKTKRRAGNVSKRNLRCNMCNATETPEWRRGPDGEHTLCNACGLHYAKVLKRDRANKTKRRKHSIESLLNKDTKKDIAAAVAAAAAAASGTSVPPAAAGAPAASTESKSVSCDDDSRKSND